MAPIGEKLREARLRQQLDIADVEDRTKIRAKYLRALENEEWGLLPGHTFVKTFLRTYAEQVGVDPHMLVEEYRITHEDEEPDAPPIAATPTVPRRGGRTRERRRAPGPPRPGALIALVAVGVVTFLLVLGLFGDEEPADRQGSSDTTATQTAPTGGRRPPARRRRPPRSGVVLRVTPSVATYACVDTGEGTDVVFEGILEAAQTFRNARRVRINLGKRSVEVRVNGKPVEVVDSPEPIGLEATTQGTQEIDEASRPCT